MPQSEPQLNTSAEQAAHLKVPSGMRAVPLAVGEHEGLVKACAVHQVQRLLVILLSFPAEARDQVSGQRHLQEGGGSACGCLSMGLQQPDCSSKSGSDGPSAARLVSWVCAGSRGAES